MKQTVTEETICGGEIKKGSWAPFVLNNVKKQGTMHSFLLSKRVNFLCGLKVRRVCTMSVLGSHTFAYYSVVSDT